MSIVLNYEDWRNAYGVCSECALDVVVVDRETWMDDRCHRHQFGMLGC